MYIYIYICRCRCVYVYAYVYVHAYAHACAYAYAYMYMHMYLYSYMYMHMHMYMYMHMCVCINMCIYIDMYTKPLVGNSSMLSSGHMDYLGVAYRNCERPSSDLVMMPRLGDSTDCHMSHDQKSLEWDCKRDCIGSCQRASRPYIRSFDHGSHEPWPTLLTEEARRLEHDRPPTPKRKKREAKHTSSCVHFPFVWSL